MIKNSLMTAFVLLLGLDCPYRDVLAQGVDAEKRATFYTAYGYQVDDVWTLPIRVWVHEEPDAARRLAARVVRSELQSKAGIDDLSDAQEILFDLRADGFISDSESRETVRLQFDADPESIVYRLRGADGRTTTDRNGLIEGSIQLTDAKAVILLDAQQSDNGWLTFRAVSDDHVGIGRVRLIEPFGISVVSDVDDTVKVTEIPAGEEAVLKNTFFRESRAAPCMAKMYSSAASDISFHYVSGGPWQMYQPLVDFLFSDTAGFPEGSFHMKDVRTNPFESESYSDIWKLIAAGSQQVTYEQKVRQISTLLEHFPDRQFILVGDSGEKDPEIFAEIREQFGNRILEIRIRDVVDAADKDPQRLAGMFILHPEADSAGECQIRIG